MMCCLYCTAKLNQLYVYYVYTSLFWISFPFSISTHFLFQIISNGNTEFTLPLSKNQWGKVFKLTLKTVKIKQAVYVCP